MKATTPPIPYTRVAQFAELLSQGLRVCEAQVAMGLTKGEAASVIRRIRMDLGWEQSK